MQYFQRLEVWKKSQDLVAKIYEVTDTLPADERFGLVSQMRRAAVSVGSNIAEGSGRSTPADFARFLDTATGSISELESQTWTCAQLGFLDQKIAKEVATSCGAIRGMLRRLRHRVLNSREL